jgi:hypothetical protein
VDVSFCGNENGKKSPAQREIIGEVQGFFYRFACDQTSRANLLILAMWGSV